MKKSKSFIIGLIVGLMLTTVTFASSEYIQVMFTDFNFVINGRQQKLETKPLLYNGTSYLPVREISNLLGYDITYKADTKTIVLNSSDQNKTNTIGVSPHNKTYQIGEKIQLDEIEITISSIEYLDKVGSFLANPDEVFAVVNFEVFTKFKPMDNFYWTSNQFVSSLNIEDISISTINSTGETSKVYPVKDNKAMVFTSIPVDKKLTSVSVYSPISKLPVDVMVK